MTMKLMFRKQPCKSCGQLYDPALDECPHCKAKSEFLGDKRLNEFSHTTPVGYVKEIILFVVGCVGLYILASIVNWIGSSFLSFRYGSMGYSGQELSNMINDYLSSFEWTIILESTVYLLLGGILVLILWDKIGQLLSTFKNKKSYVTGFYFGLVLMTISAAYNKFILLLGISSINTNQGIINDLVALYPIMCLIIFGLVGPFCEELAYRVGLFGFFKRISTWFAYVVVAVVFGLIHFSFGSIIVAIEGNPNDLIVELVNLPNYIIAGIGLAFVYDKFGFGAAYLAHATNNFVGILLQVIFNSLPQ